MRDWAPSSYYSLFQQNLRKPITIPLMQNGKLEALKPHQGESSTVNQSRQLSQ